MTAESRDKPVYEKLAKLPQHARVQKRPLHKPAIPSAYTSSDETKVVYVSTKTPFMSAVKRVEKLLRLAEKRGIQSATATVRNGNPRKRPRNEDKTEEITSIAQALHDRSDKEEVVVKGTGKAIVKALEIAAWYQQRPQYLVQLRTSTTESIDDIEIDIVADDTVKADGTATKMNADDVDGGTAASDSKPEATKATWFQLPEQKDETRVRSVSVIEVYIKLR